MGDVPAERLSAKGEYSREFKIEAVRLAFEEGEGVTQTARNLGASKSALYCWRNELQKMVQ